MNLSHETSSEEKLIPSGTSQGHLRYDGLSASQTSMRTSLRNQAKVDLIQISGLEQTADSVSDIEAQKALVTHLQTQLNEISKSQSVLDSKERQNKHSIRENKLSEDTFSFIICSRLSTGPFLIALVVFAVQILIFSLLVKDVINRSGSKNDLGIPANVYITVRATQFIAIIIAVLTQKNLQISLEQIWEGYSSDGFGQKFNESSSWKWWFSSICRLLEGGLGLSVTLLLIVVAEKVFTLLINFAVIEFVTQLDHVCFQISITGYFGMASQEKCREISETAFPFEDDTTGIMLKLFRVIWIAVIFILMFAGLGYVVYQQKSGEWLCETLRVQFSDDIYPVFGAFNGLYDRKHSNNNGKRDQYIQRVSESQALQGKFGYCEKEKAWTFTDGEDLCKWKIKSAETHSFDIETSLSSPWLGSTSGVQLDGFGFSCVAYHACSGQKCHCQAGFYGPDCKLYDPCKTLSVSSTFDESPSTTLSHQWSTTYKILETSEGPASSKSIQANFHPIYIGGEGPDFDLIFFVGRHWILTHTGVFTPIEGKGRDAIANYFLEEFHAASQTYNVFFVSDGVAPNSLSDTGSPIGLRWFHDNYVKDQNGAPSPDYIRPSDARLLCTICNNTTNPCLFEGSCQDGTCYCKNGSTGKLCENSPIGDGHCDSFFNQADFNYDGGDCCGATCMEDHICGMGALLTTTFGADISNGDGYPYCKDPSMVPITIYLEADVDAPWVSKFGRAPYIEIDLKCSGITQLHIPLRSISSFPFNGTETFLVGDGTNCELAIKTEASTFKYAVYDGKGTSSSSFLLTRQDEWMTAWTQVIIPFSVVPRCLKEVVSFNENPDPYVNMSSPQGKAIQWINEGNSKFSSCDSIFFIQRYALAVLKFATNLQTNDQDTKAWLTEGNECRWDPGITCNANAFVAEIDLIEQGLDGTIPIEVSMLEDLENLFLNDNYNLHGSIPAEVGRLSHLERFELFSGEYTGTIPSEVFGLVNLETFKVSSDKLEGFPEGVGALTNLEHLSVWGNNVSGQIPSEMGNLVKLTWLSFKGENLGTIPTEIGKLVNLEYLYLGENLSGTIPSEMGNLVKLTELTIQGDDMTGTVPIEVCTNLNVWYYMGLPFPCE